MIAVITVQQYAKPLAKLVVSPIYRFLKSVEKLCQLPTT